MVNSEAFFRDVSKFDSEHPEMLAGYDFGQLGLPMAWHQDEDGKRVLYDIINGPISKDHATAVFTFKGAFLEWLAGRSKENVIWRRRPSIMTNKRGDRWIASCRCGYNG